jgi:alpha-glucosidase
MIATLHNNHFHFGVWQWPWIDKSNSLYNTGANNHYFIENSSGAVVDGGGWHGVTFTGQFDLSTSASVNWWKSLNKPLFDMGFDFLKMDTTVGIPSGGVLRNGSTSSTDWKGFYRKAAYEITTTANLAQGRGLILAHSDAGAATNGDQYPGVWTGDSSSTFASMVSKDMGGGFKCNTKTTGAYWCGDTGGYNNNSNDELYQRWLEYGCFTPLTEFFGAKGTTGSNSNLGRFPWCFSTAAQATFTKYTQLRYRLLPFRYSNAQACYQVTGGSVQYPVWWPSSTQIINGHGDSQILVQPVTTSGATSASVVVPSGANWINYWTGAVYSGGSTQTISAAVDVVPMLVRAGSIIPMAVHYDSSGNPLAQQYVNPLTDDSLTLDIYPAGSTSYTLYEDDGISDLYISGEFTKTTFTSNITSGHEVVTISAAVGDYAGKLAAHNYVLKVNQQTSAPAGVTRDGTALTQQTSRSAFESASSGWFYDSSAKIVWVKFALSTSSSTSVAFQ